MMRRIPIHAQTTRLQGLTPVLERKPAAPPLDLSTLTPPERLRLDMAVMALVEYLVSASAKAE